MSGYGPVDPGSGRPDDGSLAGTRHPAPGEGSLGDLVGDLTGDLSHLMRTELALAKAESTQEAAQAGRGAGLLAGAAVGALLLLTFASLAAMFALGAVMPLGWAALVVAALWAVVAAVLASSGRTAIRRSDPTLPQTTQTLKEDARWASRPRS